MATVDINPAAAVRANACFFADDIVVRYETQELTYAELDDRVARLATVFAAAGIAIGDRVAYVGLNSASFVLTMLASFRLGAIFVPVNFRLAATELCAVLEKSGATVVVSEPGHRAAVDEVKAAAAVKALLLVDDDPATPVTAAASGEWEGWARRHGGGRADDRDCAAVLR